MEKVLEKIKSFFAKENQNIEKPILLNPYKAWAILFGLICVLLGSFFALNTYFFFAVKNNTLFTKTENSEINSKKYNHESLDQVLNNFINRSKSFEEIKSSNPSVTDPSK